jgi:predicted nicotinamide N-methyase
VEPEKLNENIKQTLTEARLKKTTLPLIPGLSLFLLDPINLNRKFSPEETRRIVRNSPYWSFCWAGGQALGAYLWRNKKWVRGKKVLDFGSGSGVVAISAARAGAERVIACDMDDQALEAVKANGALNQVTIETICSIDDLKQKVDIILSADLLYDPDNFPLLDQFFHFGEEVLLADARVKNFRHSHYLPIAHIEAETIPDLEEGEEFKLVKIYRGS